MVPGTWVTINCGWDEVLRALEATEGDWGTPSDSLLLWANGFGDLEVKSPRCFDTSNRHSFRILSAMELAGADVFQEIPRIPGL